MTAKSSRRVVIINNIKSDKIEQAIFILRGKANQKPDSFVLREAQELIDNYVHKVNGGGEDALYDKPFPKGEKGVKVGLITTFLVIGAISLVVALKYFGA